MKKLFYLAFILFPFLSCNQQKQENIKQNKAESELSIAISNAEQSEIIENKAFLGFQFGMNKNEVNEHILKLKDEGKIYLNSSNQYQYDFSFNGVDINLNFIPDYYEGKLYKMTYPAHLWDMVSSSEHVFLMTAFKDTRKGFKSYINKDVMGEEYYTNVKDNLIITFENSGMVYENAPISKLAKHKKDEINKDKANKSNSEF